MSRARINWNHSKAQKRLNADLEPGAMLDGQDHLSAEVCWEYYKNVPAFKKILFEQFKEALPRHREQAYARRQLALRDEKAVKKARELYPRQPRDSKGRLKFDTHPSKKLLQEDVKIARSKKEKLNALNLQHTKTDYMDFDSDRFQQRILQENKRQKFLSYLESKRKTAQDKVYGKNIDPTSQHEFLNYRYEHMDTEEL